MFLKLFGSIRNNGVPVTLREYLDLLEGLSKGLCSSNKIEDFYNFSKLCLVKDEKNYDKFDKAFNSFYEENKNIINQVEKKIPESWVFNELKNIKVVINGLVQAVLLCLEIQVITLKELGLVENPRTEVLLKYGKKEFTKI